MLKHAERKLKKVKEQEKQLQRQGADETGVPPHFREKDTLSDKLKSEEQFNLPRTTNAVSRENGVVPSGRTAKEQQNATGPRGQENGGYHSDHTTLKEPQGTQFFSVKISWIIVTFFWGNCVHLEDTDEEEDENEVEPHVEPEDTSQESTQTSVSYEKVEEPTEPEVQVGSFSAKRFLFYLSFCLIREHCYFC